MLILDEPSECATLSAHFRQFRHGCDYDVETASTGPEAAQVLHRGRPDLVVLDPQLKRINGLHFLQQLRTLDRTIPVIVVTGKQEGRAAGEVIATGVFGYIPKPCEFLPFEHLVGLVSTTL